MSRFRCVRRVIPPALAAFSLLFAPGCGGDENARRELEKWLFMSGELEKQGRLDRAFEIYRKIDSRRNHPAYRALDVDEVLESRGWTAGKIEQGYTLKVLTLLQNRINRHVGEQGGYPDLEKEPFLTPDAWERPVVLEIVREKSYDYMLKSAGPDGEWDTPDDVLLVNKTPFRHRVKKSRARQKVRPGEKAVDIRALIDKKTNNGEPE
jgi:hypothetical protein